MTERERFEAWLVSEEGHSKPAKDGEGQYYENHVTLAWKAWQARSLLSPEGEAK